MANQDPNDKYTMDKGEEFEGSAHPGHPLEPDELPESPPQFPGVAARVEKDVHPTSELSSTPSHKAGRPSSGTHPTEELRVRPRRR